MGNYKEGAYLLLDVGGTQIKGCMLDKAGRKKGDICSYPAHSQENAETIMDHFTFILKDLMRQDSKAEISGIGMAFPGPFDYENGISRMRNLNKYDSIYGIALEPELKKRMPELEKARFCFLHDIEAFAIGESWFGQMRNEKKILCLCIGTGAGSAFLENRIPLKTGPGVPENGWVYNLPYKDSIIDDYISVRGLARISEALLGQRKSGKELWELSQEKNEKAVEAFRIFGRELKECMAGVLEAFHPDAVILGGQISKSFPLFGKAFAQECKSRKIKLYIETETSEKAMQGLFVKITKG